MLTTRIRSVGPAVTCAALLAGAAFANEAAAQAVAPGAAPAEPGAVAADPAPPDPPPTINLTGSPSTGSTAPMIDLSTPAPGPPVGRVYHQHEGFYLRLGAGLGSLLSANVDAGAVELSTGGLTLNYDLLVGGSPAPGFTVGGGLLGGLQMSGDWETDGGVGVSGGDMTTLIIGPFADGHPQPNGGLHFGGMAGLAYVALDVPGGADGSSALGFGGAFWLGHDVWVAPEWSLGGQLRLDALRATNSDDDLTVTEVGLTLMFTVLYH